VSTRLAGVPALFIGERNAPPVLWFHGFGVEKETHRRELEQLAEGGFLAIGIDAAGHGERRLPDLDARIAAPREAAKATMLALARATADEVPSMIDALGVERIAIAGISMGGYVVYAALARDPRIRTAVALLGDPELLATDPEHVALLSINGECDENVPPHGARSLHARLHGTHRYVELAGEPHLVSESAWKRVMTLTIGWLREHAAIRH